MTKPSAAWLARVHAACFTSPRPWTRTEFSDMLANPNAVVACRPAGFCLAQTALDEAELLTLAVLPEARRKGVGKSLLGSLETALVRAGATRLFLEVSEDNRAALALYRSAGFHPTGRRKSYYLDRKGMSADALILSKMLIRAVPGCDS